MARIMDFFNSAGTDDSTATFQQSCASQTLPVVTSDNSVGSNVETDITKENDRPDASKRESKSKSKSKGESESDASVELLVVIPAPLVAKLPRTGHYLENEDIRLVL